MNNGLWRWLAAWAIGALVLVACGGSAVSSIEEESPAEEAVVAEKPAEQVAQVEIVAEATGQESDEMTIESKDLEIVSDGQAYLSYLAAPTTDGPHAAIVLVHSFNGLEEGYRTMTDQLAAQGFVVLALGWQTFERSPSDATVEQLIADGVAFLTSRADVDSEKLGLTGFCAGGRYTMLFLPQSDAFNAGVAWYGFPYSGSGSGLSLP